MIAMLIGIIHGLPVLIAGRMLKNNAVVMIVALVMCVIAVMTGNSSFLGTDLAWIGLGTWLG